MTTQIRNHWWWRPGWSAGTRFWTFHITWENDELVQQHMAEARRRLADVDGLDLVPARWLHLTTQGVGFADEVDLGDLEAITATARTRLAALRPVPVVIGPPVAASEGVACWVKSNGGLDTARDAIRSAIGDVWGQEKVPEGPDWSPHVSAAYASTAMPSTEVDAALDGWDATARTVVTGVQLIRLGRDRRVYEWDETVTLPLGPDGIALG